MDVCVGDLPAGERFKTKLTERIGLVVEHVSPEDVLVEFEDEGENEPERRVIHSGVVVDDGLLVREN